MIPPDYESARFFPTQGFDVIFCRNVLIYFDQDTEVDTFNRLAKATALDGFLVLGAAETVVGLSDCFQSYPERHGVYRPSGALAGRPSRCWSLA